VNRYGGWPCGRGSGSRACARFSVDAAVPGRFAELSNTGSVGSRKRDRPPGNAVSRPSPLICHRQDPRSLLSEVADGRAWVWRRVRSRCAPFRLPHRRAFRLSNGGFSLSSGRRASTETARIVGWTRCRLLAAGTYSGKPSPVDNAEPNSVHRPGPSEWHAS